jgi:hypothetical protein
LESLNAYLGVPLPQWVFVVDIDNVSGIKNTSAPTIEEQNKTRFDLRRERRKQMVTKGLSGCSNF